jgi:hypothetical protein
MGGKRLHFASQFELVILWAILLVRTALPGGSLLADEPIFPQASPEELGLVVPNAPPMPGGQRRVLVVDDEAGQGAVAQVYLEVGDHYVVLLPDGSIRSLPKLNTTETDRPFAPMEKEALAKKLTSGRFAGFRTRMTRRYLYVYNTSDAFAQATSRILETMYGPLLNNCRRWKLSVQDAQFPLVVVMFRTEEEFQKYRKMPDGFVAYYNGLSNHVVMFEQSELADLAPELAFKQSVSTIAHEGVHQILHNIGVQQRLSHWPVWFSEGLAEYFAPTQLDRRVRWKGVGLVNDLRLHELSEYYKARKGQDRDGEIIRRAVEAQTLDSLGYATSWALIDYVSRFHRDAFRDCLRHVSQLGPLQEMQAGSLYTDHFGSDFGRMETSLVEYLQALPYINPISNQTHFVLMLKEANREVLVTASPARLREKLSKITTQKFLIQAFPDRATAEAFAQAWVTAK